MMSAKPRITRTRTHWYVPTRPGPLQWVYGDGWLVSLGNEVEPFATYQDATDFTIWYIKHRVMAHKISTARHAMDIVLKGERNALSGS